MVGRLKEKRRQRERDAFIRALLRRPADATTAATRRHKTSEIDRALAAARRQLSTGRTVDCEETCLNVLSDTPDNCDALHLLAIACQRNGSFPQSVDLLNRAMALSPDDPEILASLGVVYGQQGQFAKAIATFEKTLKLLPDNVDVLYNTGLAHVQLEEYEQATALYRKAIDLRPDIAVLHLNCGSALTMAGHLAEAENCYRDAIRLDPGSVDAQFNLGTVLGRMARFGESLDAMEQVVFRSPAHYGALRGIGETRLKIGDYAGAAVALRRTVDRFPDDMKSRFDLGHALALAGDSAEAVAICETAIGMTSPTDENLITLVVAYICDGRHEAALEICDAILAEHPGHTSALAFKTTVLNELQRFDEAQYLLDTENLVQTLRLSPPEEFDSLEIFNDALCRHIRNHPTLRDSSTNRSLNCGMATADLLDDDPGPFDPFERLIRHAIDRYKERLDIEPQHPFLQGMPDRLSLDIWANIMDSDGYHAAHFHPPGWLSGTYYPALPPDEDLLEP